MMTRLQFMDMFHSNDLIGIGMEADAIRRTVHPEGIVGYSVTGKISYNEIANDRMDATFARIQCVVESGGTGILLQGVPNSHQGCAWYQEILRAIKMRFDIWCHGFSASEIVAIAGASALSLPETLLRLKEAGLDSIPGDDAGILHDEQRSPTGDLNCSAQDWIDLHKTAHSLGIPTTAAIRFGAGETIEQRLNHFAIVRQIQEETGGFLAFLPSFSRSVKQESTAVEYLKMLALSRIYLDNILHIESSGVATELKVRQLALRFGGNDLGDVPVDMGSGGDITVEQLRQLIRDAGFRPVQHDTSYRTYLLN
jgi:cyclic dehypoxanthinyl futalosine synthase